MSENETADFNSERIEGWANASGNPFSVPIWTHIEANLWMGGAPTFGMRQDFGPKVFKHFVNLYDLTYAPKAGQTMLFVPLFDSALMPDQKLLDSVVSHVVRCIEDGPTLVHCQAGLNRSGLVTALVLHLRGHTAREAIALLREKRCSEVLCNKTFESYILTRCA